MHMLFWMYRRLIDSSRISSPLVFSGGFKRALQNPVHNAENRYSNVQPPPPPSSCWRAEAAAVFLFPVLCLQVSTRHIISKLYFDIGGEEDGEGSVDPESLQVSEWTPQFWGVLRYSQRSCLTEEGVSYFWLLKSSCHLRNFVFWYLCRMFLLLLLNKWK